MKGRSSRRVSDTSNQQSTLHQHESTVDCPAQDGVGCVLWYTEQHIVHWVIFCPVILGYVALDLLLKQYQVVLKHESLELQLRQDAGERDHQEGRADQP